MSRMLTRIAGLLAAAIMVAALAVAEQKSEAPATAAADSPPAPAPGAMFYAIVNVTDHTGAGHTEIIGLAARQPSPAELQPLREKVLAAYNEALEGWKQRRQAFMADPANKNKKFPETIPEKPVVRVDPRLFKTVEDAQAAVGKAKAADFAKADPAKASRQQILRERLLDHFFWGISAPAEWMAETRAANGAKWDVQCGYLSGGAGDADDPWWLKYGAAERRLGEGARTGHVVWFTYYLLAASAPAHYKPGPAQATPVNAKVAATMKSYFELFKRLMVMCGKHGDVPVVVQIEPDEWGHLLLSAGMDPARVDVKVGSTGMEELKDLPDNLFGYAAAFIKLRDLYAPNNVLIGCNPSGWDWQGRMSGAKFGAIMKQVCPNYDLAVFETGDRDKGMHGKQPPYGNDSGICKTFDNHVKWIEEFHAASGLYVVVWQVAMGNTAYATCNNTPGHYCDNLAQTLLEDYPRNPMISRYARAGCMGWLFQEGQGDSTRAWDQKKDGVTNPPPIAGNQGLKSACADDDGGYIRLKVGEYYKQPLPILGKATGKP